MEAPPLRHSLFIKGYRSPLYLTFRNPLSPPLLKGDGKDLPPLIKEKNNPPLYQRGVRGVIFFALNKLLLTGKKVNKKVGMEKFNLVPGVLQEQKNIRVLAIVGKARIVENKKVSGDVLKLLKIIPF